MEIILFNIFIFILQSEDDDSLLANDKDIRDYLEGRTLLPVSNPIVEPGPSSTDREVAPPSGFEQNIPSSDVFQPSSNVDTTNITSQFETSNESAKKRDLDALVEMFPNFKQEQVEQALESASSDLGKAINILLEENHTGVFVCISPG